MCCAEEMSLNGYEFNLSCKKESEAAGNSLAVWRLLTGILEDPSNKEDR